MSQANTSSTERLKNIVTSTTTTSYNVAPGAGTPSRTSGTYGDTYIGGGEAGMGALATTNPDPFLNSSSNNGSFNTQSYNYYERKETVTVEPVAIAPTPSSYYSSPTIHPRTLGVTEGHYPSSYASGSNYNSTSAHSNQTHYTNTYGGTGTTTTYTGAPTSSTGLGTGQISSVNYTSTSYPSTGSRTIAPSTFNPSNVPPPSSAVIIPPGSSTPGMANSTYLHTSNASMGTAGPQVVTTNTYTSPSTTTHYGTSSHATTTATTHGGVGVTSGTTTYTNPVSAPPTVTSPVVVLANNPVPLAPTATVTTATGAQQNLNTTTTSSSSTNSNYVAKSVQKFVDENNGKQVLRTTTTVLAPVSTKVEDVEIDQTEDLRAEIERLLRRIRELEAQLSQEKVTITTVTRKVSEFESVIRSKDSEITHLRSENQRLNNFIQNLQKTTTTTMTVNESVELKNHIETLKTEVAQKNQVIEREKVESQGLRTQVQSLTQEITKFKDEYNRQKNDFNYQKEEITRKQNEIDRLRDEVRRASGSVPHQYVQEAESEKATLRKEIDRLREQINSNPSPVTRQYIQEAEADKASLRSEIDRLREEVRRASNNVPHQYIQEAEAEKANLRQQISRLQTERMERTTSSSPHHIIPKEIEEEITNLRQQNTKLKLEKSGAVPQSYIQETEAELSKLRLQISKLQAEKNTSVPQSYIQDTEAELARLRSQINKLQSERGINPAELQEAEAENLRLKNQINKLIAEKSLQAPADTNEYLTRINKLRMDLDQAQDLHLQESKKAMEYKKVIDNYELTHSEQNKQIEILRSENLDNKWKIEKADQTIESLKKELKSAGEERERQRFPSEVETKLRTQVEMLTKDNQAKDEKISQLTHNYATLNTRYNEMSEVSSKRDIPVHNEEAMYLIKEENENLRRINNKYLEELKELRGENHNLRSTRSSYHQGREYQELNNKLMLLENKIANDRENEKISSLKSRNKELENKVRQLEFEQEKTSDLHAEIRSIREEMQKERYNNLIHTKEKEAIESKLKERESEIEILKDVNSQLESEINQWKVKCELVENAQQSDEDIENKDLHYIEQIEGLKQLVDEKEEELAIWKNEVRKMEEEINALYNDNEGHDKEEMEQKIRQYEEVLKQISEENEQYKMANSEMANKLEAVDEVIHENDQLKGILKQLKGKLEVQLEVNRTVCKRSARELELKRKLEEEISSKVEEMKKFSETTTEYASRSYAEEISNLKVEASKQYSEYNDLKQKNKELKAEIEIVKEENREYEATLQEYQEEQEQ